MAWEKIPGPGEEPSTTLQCSRFGARRTDSLTFHWTDLPYQTSSPSSRTTLYTRPSLSLISINASLTDSEYLHHPSLLFRWATATWGDFNWGTGECKFRDARHHGHIRGHAGHCQRVRGHAVLHGEAWGHKDRGEERKRRRRNKQLHKIIWSWFPFRSFMLIYLFHCPKYTQSVVCIRSLSTSFLRWYRLFA